MKYSKLLSPTKINGLYIRNRVVMPPIGSNFASVTGEVTEQMKKYYSLRAKGGTGLIIVENACVDYPMGTNGTKQLRIDNVQYVPGLYELVEEIHSYGAKACIQINHAGASAYGLRLEGKQPVSASNIPSKTGGTIPRPLKKGEILEIVKTYGQAAKNAKLAGFDMVEIHAGHSYLLSQFLSPLFNDRTDEFGGSYENRARFTRLVIDEIRKQVGDKYPISLRISAEDRLKGGNSLSDTIKTLEYLVDGIDVINVSVAQNDNLYLQHDAMSLPEGWRSYMAKEIKEAFDIPVMTSGNLRTPEVVEKILEEENIDFAVMGRGLISEPNWVNKVSSGDEKKLRKCISCNIGCADHRLAKSQPIRCSINPDLINEDLYKNKNVKKTTNVAIIGAGPAGMEAACTAAEVGCKVNLYEKKDCLGGIIADAKEIPSKAMMNFLTEYYKNRISELDNINVNLSTNVDDIEKLKEDNDLVVIATGSKPMLPPIKGLDESIRREDKKVFTTFEFLDNIERFDNDYDGKKIIVGGGGAVGLDLVEFFAQKNAEVTCIEMQESLGVDLDTNTKLYMKDLLEKYNVNKYTNYKIVEIKEKSFVIENSNGEKAELEFDLGFLCLGMTPNNSLIYNSHSDVEVMNIGDSYRPRKIIDGVKEGRNIIKKLEVMDLIK